MSLNVAQRSRRPPAMLLLALALGMLAGFGTVRRAMADGVREIDQSCATMTGCFSGDAPGFPVTIDGSAGRSYRLTTSLRPTGPTGPGSLIQILADDVTLDLNGFEVSGCTAEPCTPTAASPQIAINGTGTGIVVRNGRVRAAREYGILLAGPQSVVDRIVINEVGSSRLIELGPASIVSRVSGGGSSNQPDALVTAGPGSIFERTRLTGVGNVFILRVQAGSLLLDSSVSYYLSTSTGAAVGALDDIRIARINFHDESSGPAVLASSGASIAQNLVSGNLDAGTRSHVQGNLIDTPNAGPSLILGQESTYRDNVVSGLGVVAPVDGVFFLDMGANACNGSIAACP